MKRIIYLALLLSFLAAAFVVTPKPSTVKADGITFTDISAGLTGVSNSSVAWGDYDNDGDLDLLIAGCSSTCTGGVTKIYRNTAGSFTDISAGLTGVYGASAAWGDYDNDNDLDVILTGCSSGDPCTSFVAKIYRNTNGSFSDINAGLTGMYLSAVAWGDYDNDGDFDVVLAGCTASSCTSYTAKIYRNDSGTFTDINASITGGFNSALAWEDYDNDLDLDLLITGTVISSQYTKLYRNDSGTFTDIGAGLTGVQEGSVDWGDYDNDGDADILLMGSPDGSTTEITRIFRNEGSGTFTSVNPSLTGVRLGSASWGDFNNDGYLDILLTGWNGSSGTAKIYQNSGSGSFTDISAGLTSVYYSSSAWGDYDSDGDLDILHSGCTGGSPCTSFVTKIYRNSAIQSTNQPPTVDANGPYNVVKGGSVTVSATGNDPENGTLLYEWDLDNNNSYEVQAKETSFSAASLSVGSYTIRAKVTDNANLTASDEATVQVVYDFDGFYSPVDNIPVLNSVNAGQALAVKFSLDGNQGLSIFASGYPKSETIACSSSASVDGIEETVTAGSSGLTYNAATDTYTYTWKTSKSWENTCRQLILKLTDGTYHRANFKFK